MRIFLSFVLILLASISTTAQVIPLCEKTTHNPVCRHFKHPHLLRDLALPSSYDVVYYRCNWNIDPANLYVQGDVLIRYTVEEAAFDTLPVDLSSELIVDSILYQDNAISFQHANDIIRIPVDILPMNSLDSVRIYYHGVPPDTGLGSFSQATKHENSLRYF